ncbi:MAG: RNA methyltransferase [Candidatus Cloacimonadaceae bacterium]|jgi:tRNA G18 (ribose-2'-O)-methylase SpoU|nr:RNA methyltransferase [Candidatus Cloacimonadota bacterium]MDX9950021.1 RNA methyltransferase [Candidatus Syntrophosphaera sp.]
MKFLGSYSKKKFQNLAPQTQLKALEKLAEALEENLEIQDAAAHFIGEIQDCVSWMEKPVPQVAIELSQALDKAKTHRDISLALAPFQNSLGKNLADSHLQLPQRDGARFADPKTLNRASRIILILDNLRSAFNVGSIFRGADCLGIGEIWLCGVSPLPGNPALAKTARGTEEKLVWRHFSNTIQAVEEAKTRGRKVYALETSPESSSVFETDFQLPLALLLGNESHGIGEALKLCDHIVSLPVQGWKNSLNVAVAASVCAYQIVFGHPTSLQTISIPQTIS